MEPPVSTRYTFTSESVTEGHPDKMADQISDSVLDALLAEDPDSRVACETLLTTGLVLVAGEITTSTYVDIPKLVRQTVLDIGYDDDAYGIDGQDLRGHRLASTSSRPTSARASTTPSRSGPAPGARTSSTPRAPATRG